MTSVASEDRVAAIPYTWALEHPGMRRMIVRLFVAAVVVFVFLPLATLVLWSVAGAWFWPALVPSDWSLRWYEQVLENPRVVDAMILSFTIAPVVKLLTALVAVPAGYAFARLNVPYRRVLLLLFLVPNAFPRIGLYVSLAVLYYQLELIDTFWGVVFLHMIGTLVYMTWITTATFRSLNPSLEEAARDAGASPVRRKDFAVDAGRPLHARVQRARAFALAATAPVESAT